MCVYLRHTQISEMFSKFSQEWRHALVLLSAEQNVSKYLRSLFSCHVGIYSHQICISKTVLWSLEGVLCTHFTDEKFKKWEMQGKFDEHSQCLRPPGSTGFCCLLLWVDVSPRRAGNGSHREQSWCSASSPDCHDALVKIMTGETNKNIVAWGRDKMSALRQTQSLNLPAVHPQTSTQATPSVTLALPKSPKEISKPVWKLCGKDQSLNGNHHLVSLKMKRARKMGHPTWCLGK